MHLAGSSFPLGLEQDCVSVLHSCLLIFPMLEKAEPQHHRLLPRVTGCHSQLTSGTRGGSGLSSPSTVLLQRTS